MKPVIRPLLIRLGLGRQYFQTSNRPEVRALAALAYLKKFNQQAIPLKWLAEKIVWDCISPEIRIQLKVTDIYKDFIHKFLAGQQFDLLRDHLYDLKAKAEGQNQPLQAMTIFSLVEVLGLMKSSR